MTSVMSNPPRAEQQIRRWLAFVVVVALFVWLAIVWVHFGRTIIRFYCPLPYFDYWNTVGRIDDYLHLQIGVLWHQHNEHRLVFPEIIFAADYIFFRGREILPLALSVFFFLGTWFLLSVTLFRNRSLSLTARLCAILLAGIVWCWEGSALLIAAPFLIQWSLLLAAATLALFLLARLPGTRRPGVYLAGSIACSIVSTYTSANGLLLWPVILLAAWLLCLTKSQFVALCVSATASIGLYFFNYHFSAGTGQSSALTHPFYAISFLTAYLGMPFTAAGPQFGLAIGFFELAAYVGFVLLASRRRLLTTETAVVLLGFYLLCILTAMVTAFGRMNPQDLAFGAATAHRYIVVPVAAHATLILIATWLWGNSRHYLWVPFLSVFAIGYLAAGSSPGIAAWRDMARHSLMDCQLASLAFESGVDDPQLMASVFPGGGYVKSMLPVLRNHHLSTFADGKMDWLGRPVSSLLPMSNFRQPGAVTSTYPLASGLLVVGWTDSAHRIWRPEEVILVNEQRRIVGLGRKLRAGFPGGLASSETPPSIAWVGFINSAFPSSSFSVYIIGHHGKNLIPAGGPFPIPPIRAMRGGELGPPLQSLRWNAQGDWIKNGPIPGGAPPISYYENHSERNANTGVLTSTPFSKPPGNCLVLANAHGPSTEGLSERLINADTNVTIAYAPLIDRYSDWNFWSIKLPPDIQRLQIVAEDRGRRLEQWLAISEPHFCK